MPNTRKILRVFLASPGDLKDERIAIRDVVIEFNESWADALGYQIDLMGWEDTVSGFGRPQHLINQELDKCDLFIGMIWKRWGTPPDKDGGFTSGFHEEFDRSVDRRERDESPEISLFFKKIPPGYMADPGNDPVAPANAIERLHYRVRFVFFTLTRPSGDVLPSGYPRLS